MTDPNAHECAQPDAGAPLPVAPRKTSRLAVTGLVCGILTLFLWVLAALPGVICSIVALRRIKQSKEALGGRGLAIAGLTTSICLFFLVPMLSGPLMGSRTLALRYSSKNNMACIGKTCFLYSSEGGYGQPPASLQDLFRVSYLDDERVITNPLTQRKDYTFLPYAKDAPATRIILIEGPGSYENDICVLFLDGVVVALNISGTVEQTRFAQALIKGDTPTLLEFRTRLGLHFDIPGERTVR